MESLFSDSKINETTIEQNYIDKDSKDNILIDQELKISKRQIKREKNKEKWLAAKGDKKKKKKKKVIKMWFVKSIMIELD